MSRYTVDDGLLVDLYDEAGTHDLIGVEHVNRHMYRVRRGRSDGTEDVIYDGPVSGVHDLLGSHGVYGRAPDAGQPRWYPKKFTRRSRVTW